VSAWAALAEDALVRGDDKSAFLMAIAKNLAASERGTNVRDRLTRLLEERARA